MNLMSDLEQNIEVETSIQLSKILIFR